VAVRGNVWTVEGGPDPGATSGFMFDLVFADEDRRRQEVVGSVDGWNWWRNAGDGSALFLLKTEKNNSQHQVR